MMIDIETIKYHARDQWLSIISSQAPQLSEACERPGQHIPCPCHGKTDGFRLFADAKETGGGYCNLTGAKADGFAILQWVNGWTFSEAREAVANYLGLSDSIIPVIRKRTPRPQPKKDWRREHRELGEIWAKAIPNHPRLNKYLEYRGLSIAVPDFLRLHPSLEYWYEGKSYGRFPCMVTRITRNGKLVGIHRTFLDPDGPGKASIPEPKLSKKCADSMTGGAIQLFDFDPEKPLVLCEGIETALAIHDYSGWPVWPCVNSTMLEKVVLPDNVRSVFIGADKDLSGAGQTSAEKLSRRLVDEDRKVKISFPPAQIPDGAKSIDWLDYITQEVAHG